MAKPLSPVAQSVWDAFNNAPFDAIAAAFRAAASELRKAYANEEYVDSPDDWLDDIASELEGNDPTNIHRE